jgi:hypothetical protein
MHPKYSISEITPSPMKFIAFGPKDPELGISLMAPVKLSAVVAYEDWECTLRISCVFQDSKLGLERVVIDANNPQKRTINTSLTQNLEIPKIMRELSLRVFPNSANWANRSSQDSGPHASSDQFIAQIYWFENATWGKPRLALMNYMNWSRTNANWHIKRLAKNPEIGMPGIHSKNVKTKGAQESLRGTED